MSATATAARSPVAAVAAQLEGRVAPIRLSLGYRLGLVAVALVLLTLVALYFGLIAAGAAGVVWHAVAHAEWLHVDAMSLGMLKFEIIAYLAPLVAGSVLVLFLLKPLLAPRSAQKRAHRVTRAQEPALYGYVSQLARYVGAPEPHWIEVNCDVNAYASFAGGWSTVLRRELVLTIGLPLAAGLDLRGLTGVLAHELGHFSQGAGMRLMTLVRGVNLWFARMAFERDGWDEALVRAGKTERGSAVVLLVLLFTRLTIAVARGAIAGFMVLGHAVSVAFVRQMEFDADRYEAEVAGSDAFESSMIRLHVLKRGFADASGTLAGAWMSRKLVDDLPSLIADSARRLDKSELTAVRKAALGAKTRWRDTHPSPSERIRAVRRQRREGVVRTDLPGTALFRDFSSLARILSLALYRTQLGEEVRPDQLLTRDALDERRGRAQQALAAFERLFGDSREAGELGVLGGGAGAAPRSAADAVRALATAKAVMAADRRVAPLREVSASVPHAEVSPAVGASPEVRARAWERVRAALDALAFPEIVARLPPGSAVAVAWGGRLREAMVALEPQAELIRQIHDARRQLMLQVSMLKGGAASAAKVIAALLPPAQIRLRQLRERLELVPNPLDRDGQGGSLGAHLVPAIPLASDLNAVAQEVHDTSVRLEGFQMRVMGELASITEAVELALGFDAPPDLVRQHDVASGTCSRPPPPPE